ncbi:MAG: lipid A deacylase LpxR family protein [Bacteroidaceae bacterium]|nr:lipid A deacylase LpxR family protein [Bacteroidaceae bacterium]
MRNLVLLLITLIFSWSNLDLLAQGKPDKHEIGFITDNDLYVSLFRDRYYTNGFYLNYRYLSTKRSEHLLKQIFEMQVGHQIYNPYKATVLLLSEHDRPYAAYLYGAFALQNNYKNGNLIKLQLQLGVIGKKAFGREIQEAIHVLHHLRKMNGWDYQIANAFVLNLNTMFSKHLASRRYADLHWTNQLRMGTIFTDLFTGLYGRIGLLKLQPLSNSIAYHTQLNNISTKEKKRSELFIQTKLEVGYALYNATIQGSFLNNNSPITYPITPFQIQGEVGLHYKIDNLSLAYTIHYYSKKIRNEVVPFSNTYGSIEFNVTF